MANEAAAPAPKLSIRSLARSYGRVAALRPVSLDVQAGEFVTLLGPSGSGKTTLLQAVAGLVRPDAGEILIDGRPITDQPPFRRDIGMVFQNYALFPHLTVTENVEFPLKMRRLTRKQVGLAVEEMLEVVGLRHVARRFPHELSGGQQQRIAFARAIVYRPSIVLMDEPLSALDKKLREQMQLEIIRLHKQLNTTIIYVTHDQDEAMIMSDRIVLMRDGQMEQIGSPQEIYSKPKTVFSAEFLGSSNVFPGRICEVSVNNLCVRSLDGFDMMFARTVSLTWAAGDPVAVVVRPEHVRVGQADTGSDGARIFVSATLERTINVGVLTRAHFRLRSGKEVSAAFMASAKSAPLVEGTETTLSWTESDCSVLSL